MGNHVTVVRPGKAVNESVEKHTFMKDLGSIPQGKEVKFTIAVEKEVAEGKIPTGCWCTAAKQRGQFIDFAIMPSGKGNSQKTVTYSYVDGSKFSVVITYVVV